MVFLVQDFVNLPADQIGNIWIAAHMHNQLKKKDIKKTKLSQACDQLHADKTRKPMQLRHYGQCLYGITWLHSKQVGFLHDDCTEAFTKARLVLVRKRKVDLDPEQGGARNITLPEQRQRGDEEDDLDLDLNATNFSQLDMDIDMDMEMGSLLGSVSGDVRNDNLALDHEITLQENEFHVSPQRDRRSSFGGISSVLMGDLGDMDIEIRFDDDDDEGHVLEESHSALGDMTDDDNASVEQGRGANTTLMHNENLSDLGSLHQQQHGKDIGISLLDDNHSQISEHAKGLHLDDVSAHSGSAIGGIPENMEIDDHMGHGMDMDDQQSLHVQFDDAQSINGSVATADMAGQVEVDTPPGSPRAANKGTTTPNAKKTKSPSKKAKKTKKRKKKKPRFTRDKVIEYTTSQLRASNLETAPFINPAGRDAIHIWREFPLSTLSLEELITQPLSKLNFRTFPEDVAKQFAFCNQLRVKGKDDKKGDDAADLSNALNLKDDVEVGRDDHAGMDLSMPMHDMSFGTDLNHSLHSMQSMDHCGTQDVIHDQFDKESTIEQVVNDLLPEPQDPLFHADNVSILEDEEVDVDPLSFGTEDHNILTQAPVDTNLNVTDIESGAKPRDWSKRAKKTFTFFNSKPEDQFSFDQLMTADTKRKTVVGVFYELLVFKNTDLVDLQQDTPFGDITITKTDNFHRHARVSQRLSQAIGH